MTSSNLQIMKANSDYPLGPQQKSQTQAKHKQQHPSVASWTKTMMRYLVIHLFYVYIMASQK